MSRPQPLPRPAARFSISTNPSLQFSVLSASCAESVCACAAKGAKTGTPPQIQHGLDWPCPGLALPSVFRPGAAWVAAMMAANPELAAARCQDWSPRANADRFGSEAAWTHPAGTPEAQSLVLCPCGALCKSRTPRKQAASEVVHACKGWRRMCTACRLSHPFPRIPVRAPSLVTFVSSSITPSLIFFASDSCSLYLARVLMRNRHRSPSTKTCAAARWKRAFCTWCAIRARIFLPSPGNDRVERRGLAHMA